MSEINDGGPAFPDQEQVIRHGYAVDEYRPVKGMKLRDYFAAKALQTAADDELRHPTYDEASYKGAAERAYLYADAMLKARAK